ncbi:ribosomal protection-like ABC-F family protein [Streptomyces sp. NPDC047434]|uniref:ribosomal protection-like ABC-F family protein n=1 Tax=Streptomyces sp. NPDC047434 TaxID=3155143 RepID=UPI0033EC5D41
MRERALSQLAVKDVSKAYGPRTVLERVSFTARPGERIAVVGENGSGKSTLLRLLAGADTADEGEITVRAPGGVGHLAQTISLPPSRTVQDAVDAALAALRELEQRIRRYEDGLADATPEQLDTYGDLLHAFEERGGYEADARMDAALHALGIGRLARDRALGTLSGGERSRLALACVLSSGAELLLLDEPTNHLDVHATRWLKERLAGHRGTVVTVTHDRAFLADYATAILEVDGDTRAVRRYGDGWTGYRTAKAAARRRQAQEHLEWLDEVARTEALVEAAGQRLAATGKDPRQGFGKHRRSSESKLSGQVRTARVRLEELRAHPVGPPPEPLRFAAALTATRTEGVLAELADVAVGGRLRVPRLRVEAGSRLLVSGPNGAGKSTLLRVLAGDLPADRGLVRHSGARIGYLPQEPARVPFAGTLLEAYAAGRGPAEELADELLAWGLFGAEDLETPVAGLSVGQQRRLELARLVARPADLLVLDEPTNHIAPALAEELEEALAGYPGALVVVSHDAGFRGRFVGDRLELRGGRPAA